jgi:GNAT superfamily N-acetyltransferase
MGSGSIPPARSAEILGGLLGDIWAAWLHVGTLAVAGSARGRGFGKEPMKRAELYAVERGCTDAFLDTFRLQVRPFGQPAAPRARENGLPRKGFEP